MTASKKMRINILRPTLDIEPEDYFATFNMRTRSAGIMWEGALSKKYPARQRTAATKPEQIAVPAHPKVRWLPVRSVRIIESIVR